MQVYKRGKSGIYWYRFKFDGQLIAESTKQTNYKVAKNIAADRRSNLAKERDGRNEALARLQCRSVERCPECSAWYDPKHCAHDSAGKKFCGKHCRDEWTKKHRTIPTLTDFLKTEFLPKHVNGNHTIKEGTREYYSDGAKMLSNSTLGSVAIDELNDEHSQQFAVQYAHLSASRINCGLRTLRRALILAKLDKTPKITLAKGERQRNRVLTDEELTSYLAACPQPWKDCATIISEQGTRPGEVFALRWSHILLNESGGLIRIVEGKSKAARRILDMTPNVHALLLARHREQGKPVDGWIFPSTSKEGHFNKDTAKDQHAKALADSGVLAFEPYVLRHTALTGIATETRCDVFTLARIAGHSSITMTQRYVHPEDDAVSSAFEKWGAARKTERQGVQK